MLLLLLLLTGCASTPYDSIMEGNVDHLDPPRFVKHDFVNLNDIKEISKFRSGWGHAFTDDFERPDRSMKHYYQPKTTVPVRVYSPVDGIVTHLQNDTVTATQEARGQQFWIRSSEYGAIEFMFMHVDSVLSLGQRVRAGDYIGTSATSRGENFDMCVRIYNRLSGRRLISYISVLNDQVFSTYLARGATDRSQFIISKEYRDLNPVINWNQDHDQNWVTFPIQ